MTREEAIKGLKVLAKDFSGYKPNEEMFDMAIKALERTECEDAVSKEAVSSWLKQYGQDVLHGKYKFSLMYIWKKLMDLPSVTPKQPGWIPVTERLPQNGYWLWSANGGVVKKDFYWDGHWELAEKYGYEVLAWMPLPTPYREGGQDNA